MIEETELRYSEKMNLISRVTGQSQMTSVLYTVHSIAIGVNSPNYVVMRWSDTLGKATRRILSQSFCKFFHDDGTPENRSRPPNFLAERFSRWQIVVERFIVVRLVNWISLSTRLTGRLEKEVVAFDKALNPRVSQGQSNAAYARLCNQNRDPVATYVPRKADKGRLNVGAEMWDQQLLPAYL
jgi:hypothetical protein